MKQTKITPGSNLMWESSRMMLPEHKEAILNHRQKQHVKDRLDHDEQAWEDMLRMLQDSKECNRLITITKYGPYSNTTITGIVERMEKERGILIKDRWIPWLDIIDVHD